MKKVLVLISIFIISSTAFAQNKSDSTSYTNNILAFKTNPVQIAIGECRIAVEKSIHKNMSIEIGIGYVYMFAGIDDGKGWAGFENPFKYSGYDIRGGVRFYKKKKQFQGLYFNPLLFYKNVNYHNFDISDSEDSFENIENIGVQFLFGKKRVYNNNIIIDFYLGLSVRKINVERHYYDRSNSSSYDGGGISMIFPAPQFGFTLGYQFRKKKK